MVNNKKTVVTGNGYRNFADELLGFWVDAYQNGTKVDEVYVPSYSALKEVEESFHKKGFVTETFWTRVDTTD